MFGYLCGEFWLSRNLFSKTLKGNWVIDLFFIGFILQQSKINKLKIVNQKSQAVPATVSYKACYYLHYHCLPRRMRR